MVGSRHPKSSRGAVLNLPDVNGKELWLWLFGARKFNGLRGRDWEMGGEVSWLKCRRPHRCGPSVCFSPVTHRASFVCYHCTVRGNGMAVPMHVSTRIQKPATHGKSTIIAFVSLLHDSCRGPVSQFLFGEFPIQKFHEGVHRSSQGDCYIILVPGGRAIHKRNS